MFTLYSVHIKYVAAIRYHIINSNTYFLHGLKIITASVSYEEIERYKLLISS